MGNERIVWSFVLLGAAFCLLLWQPHHPTHLSRSALASRRLKKTNPVVERIRSLGGPLCREEMLPASCPMVTCMSYEDWHQSVYRNQTTAVRRKVILSVGHNGFGNQLFQHYFALQLAQHLNAVLYITKIEIKQSPGSSMPPNTHEGAESIDRVSDPLMFWSSLPPDHPDKLACLRSNVTYSKRPVDIRSRNSTQQALFADQLINFLDPNGEVECLISIGYFQSKDICVDTVHKMWPALVNQPNRSFVPKISFLPSDIVLHLRCQPSHYGVPSLHSLQVILNITHWSHLYIVRPPTCTAAIVTRLISSLLQYPNSSIVHQSPNPTGFDDFILLSTANKLVEDVSTYSYWAGIFSNAAEKHVDTNFHGILKIGIGNDTRLATSYGYVYHDSKHDNYFGEPSSDGKVTYRYHLPASSMVNRSTHHPHPHQGTHPPPHSATSHGKKHPSSANRTHSHHTNRTTALR